MNSPDVETLSVKLDEIIGETGKEAIDLISILQKIQREYQYLPVEALYLVSDKTGIKAGQVFGVATFYSQFRLKKAGKHRIKVCIGTACHVKGAGEIFNAYKEYLEIDQDNDTDEAGVFTVEKVACLGCCVLAPAVQIDDIIYGNLTIGKVGDTITDFLKSLTGLDHKTERPIKDDNSKGEVRICRCSSCSASGANKVYKAIEKVIDKNRRDVVLKSVSCSGMSYKAPIIEIVDKDNNSFFYGNVTSLIIEEIIFSHFKPDILGKLHFHTKRLLFKIGQNRRGIPLVEDLIDLGKGEDSVFGNCQKKLVTETAGELEPKNLTEYKKNGGFKALETVLSEDSRENIIGILKKSGLRGRGGAGYQTYLKWEKIFHGGSGKRYLICNGDEGDPGAFMDRMILESFPFRVLEGIAIAALTLGIREVFLYIRAEYPLAIKRIREAVKLCMDDSLLADIDIAFRICEGAGAFVCGEETALIEAIEGKRGEPREKGPYPAEFGLYGCPTLVNNVETFASIPWIIGHGGEKFSALGTKDSPGTKLFALAGKINRGGLIEVPMGITLRDIVNDIGGGIENDGLLKAVQIGGPSGGCVPDYLCDTKIDYNELKKTGAIMGSGGLVVIDKNDCMVDLARYFMAFTQKESCGRCSYCRIGTKRMLEILTNLCENRGRKGDIEKLEFLGQITSERSKCGLGKTASNPVLSTIQYFRDEYEASIDGTCPAGICRELIRYEINDNCIGCTKCSVVCNMDAIAFTPYEKHRIIQEKCVKCGACRQICPSGAIDVN